MEWIVIQWLCLSFEPFFLFFLYSRLENESDLSAENPLFQDTFQELADPLPFAKHERSKLICKISKEIMDDHNPPLVLPNGYAYGKNVSLKFNSS